jgi:hypothetical protein
MSFEYLTAKQASAIALDAQSIKGSYLRGETDRIMEQIALLAAEGATECTAAFVLHKIIQDRLKHLGYTVKITSDQRDGSYTVISW